MNGLNLPKSISSLQTGILSIRGDAFQPFLYDPPLGALRSCLCACLHARLHARMHARMYACMHARCMHARTLKAGWVRTVPRRTCEIRADMDGVVDAAPRVALEGEAAVQAADLHLRAPPPPRLSPAPRLRYIS